MNSPREGAAPRLSRRMLAMRACCAVAALCQLAWVAALARPGAPPARTSYVSELMALDQPWGTPLRAVDGLAGIAVLAGVALARPMVPARGTRSRPWVLTILVCIAVTGAATLVDALSPMSCSPTLSEACALAEHAGAVPFPHRFHPVSSSIAIGGVVVTLLVVVASLWRLPAARPVTLVGRAVRWSLTVAAVALVATTVWSLVEVAGATPGTPLVGRVGVDAVGLSQRLQVTIAGLCLLLLALLLPARRGRRVGPDAAA